MLNRVRTLFKVAHRPTLGRSSRPRALGVGALALAYLVGCGSEATGVSGAPASGGALGNSGTAGSTSGAGGGNPCGPIPPGAPCKVAGQLGTCSNGTKQCVDGELQCVQTTDPTREFCDGLDNDCNGVADDNLASGACFTSLRGVCGQGIRTCLSGRPACIPDATPTTETCNGLDDDCDGSVDEEMEEHACEVPGQLGPCREGLATCEGAAGWVCTQLVQASEETCNDIDDDCDGVVDNVAAPGQERCATELPGLCAQGTIQCSAGAPACVPRVSPGAVPELCNGIDDDCDGAIDEDAPGEMCARPCGLVSLPDVSSIACASANGVSICEASCPAGLVNTDGDLCNGCEARTCSDRPALSSCTAPLTIALEPATFPTIAETLYSGQLASLGATAWISVQFNEIPQEYTGFAQIGFYGTDYTMDIIDDCTVQLPVACPFGQGSEGPSRGLTPSPTASAVNFWEMSFGAPGAKQPEQLDASILAQPVLLRITRVSLQSGNCAGYGIRVLQEGTP